MSTEHDRNEGWLRPWVGWVALVLGVLILGGGLAAALGPSIGTLEILVLTVLVVVVLLVGMTMIRRRREGRASR